MIEALLQAERLLVHGMTDQAEEMYRRVAEQDPLNAIAVVGLARVALERGDERLAYERARAALEIDRENVAALRLEARLSEVFATRGAPVERPAWLDSGQSPPAVASLAPSPSADQAAADPGEARPSERFVFERNPTMADHRRRDEEADQAGRPGAQADRPDPQADRPDPPADSPALPPAAQRAGLLRRILGR